MKKKYLIPIIFIIIFLTNSSNYDYYYQILYKMTLTEKIGQLFVIRPESLCTNISLQDVNSVTKNGLTEINDDLKNEYIKYPVGGFILFDKNITSYNQLIKLNKDLHSLNNIKPYIYIDEEGGAIARIANNRNLNIKNVIPMFDIGLSGDSSKAYETGEYIGQYLYKLGFDVDCAPDADVLSKIGSKVIGKRSFSSNPQVVSEMSYEYLKGLKSQNILGCYKHFPGHGSSTQDTHINFGYVNKTWEELLNSDLIPFINGIKNDIPYIMVAHIKYPEITKEDVPASLSKEILTDKLRKELNFNGIIITDGMSMGAITKNYSQEEACIKAINAGVDIILMPYSYKNAFISIQNAVYENKISEERINESVYRILKLKLKNNNIS